MASTDNEEQLLHSVARQNAQSIRVVRRRAEEALRKQSEWLRVTLASIGDGVISTDADGRITFMNAVAESLTGWRQDDVLGQPLDGAFRIINEQTREQTESPLTRVLRDGAITGLTQHTVLVGRDGSERPIDDSAAPIRDEDGHLIGCVLVFRDVSERRRAENDLHRSERELADFFDNANVGLHWVGADGIILRVNQAELDLLGYAREEYVGRPIAEFHVDRSVIDAILRRLACGDTLREYPARLRCKDGSVRDVLINTSGYFENGRFIHSRCFTLDITQRKQAEEELADANRRKDDFIATLSHELRNPLAPIRNAVRILKSFSAGQPKLEWCRNLIDQEVSHMSRLMEDLLDVSRITRSKLELRKQSVELHDVIEHSVALSQPLIESGGHKLSIELPPKPLRLNGDSARLNQVFANLLNNAAKFTQRNGDIHLRAELTATGAGSDESKTEKIGSADESMEAAHLNSHQVVVSVEDSGIGIAPEMLPHIFDMFFQADSGKERSYGGLGIGLSLARTIIDLHGGTIAARSGGLGQGSQFVVCLPLDAASGETRKDEPVSSQEVPMAQGKRVAIVEDNKLQAQSLAILLEMMGYQVRTASDASTALSMIAEFVPQVALIDIGLPGLNGYELARRLRDLPQLRDITLIAQTGWGTEDDREQARQAGFQHHLTKPIDHKRLEEILAQATQ
jgi:PAS domain S-box-containing protein